MKRTDPRVQAWASRIVRQVKYRASRSGLPFNINRQYLLDQWTGACPVFGFDLVFNSKPTPRSPSLDRRIPGLGYTKGNVVVISMKANAIKADATPRELRKVADWLEQEWRLSHE